MFIENFLAFCTARLTQRYLASEEYLQCLPPKPNKDSSYLLYMHIPFCEELCPYCSFVKVKFEPSLACHYFDALKKEVELYHKLGYCFDAIYVGGGTPTIMPDRLAEIIEFVKGNWQIKQISVETNPNHLTPEILGILKAFGTNRLSIGVQSFNNEILESIQRLEKYGCGEEIKERVSSVVGMFDTVNIDMIFNFPNQTEQMLSEDIKIIKEIKADQVTYYPLMVSNSRKKEIAKRCGKTNYEQEKQLYQLITEQLADAYNQESIWCFSAKKGVIDEYILDHDEYVGLGPGSWGYINGAMYSNTFSIQQYIRMIQENKSPIIANRNFSTIERIRYCFLLKLLSGTVSVSDMRRKHDNHFRLYLCVELLFLFITGAIRFRDNNIMLTAKGRYYWIVLMRTLFSTVGDYREKRTIEDSATNASKSSVTML